jgi:NAD(P)-dependent dehydrogenase (short-subunit alcohol dehydrogenase family)
MNPKDKIVIVTGASSGIGAATAQAFSEAGARVALAARNAEQLEALARSLPGPVLVAPTDITDQAAVDALVARTVAEFGGVDIVVNNAGVGLAAPIAELSQADFERALAVDLFGPLALTRAVLPHMLQAKQGQLIFISSVVGLRALPYLGGYAAAKAALDRLTEALRVELRGSGITITLVRPGTTRTSFAEHRLGNGRERRRVSGRSATPAQVAHAIVRAAQREPRVAYVSLADRLQVLVSLLTPRLADWLLARAFRWESGTGYSKR